MQPSERDLERAHAIVSEFERGGWNTAKCLEMPYVEYKLYPQTVMTAMIAEALAAERMSLPESALEEVEMAISYLQTAVGLCEQLHEHVGDHDAAYISLSGEFEQAHDDLKEELAKIRRWQQEGPEPRKDVSNE